MVSSEMKGVAARYVFFAEWTRNNVPISAASIIRKTVFLVL